MKSFKILGWNLALPIMLMMLSMVGSHVLATPVSLLKKDSQLMTRDTLPSPVALQIAAINQGDVTTWLNLFPADGVVNDWGRIFTGHKAIRAWSDREFIGAKGQITVQFVKVEGSIVTVDAGWKSNFYSGASRFVFIVEEDKVREMRITSLKD